MKIEYIKGDLMKAPEKYIAHGCNAKGVMGSGVAKLIRAKWPDAYDHYRYTHETFRLIPGRAYFVECGDKTIINCITQESYGRDGRQYADYGLIIKAIQGISEVISDTPVALPMIGAGLGGGDWNKIEEIIEEHSTFQPRVYQL